MSIVTWNDLYHQLWIQAAQSRGTITSVGELPGSTRYSTIPEWPRTTGADAIAIASLIDPILSALPLRPGGYGITRLWQTAVIELESLAFAHPAAEYAHNRSLWSTVLAVAAHLDTMDAPLPDQEAWEALLATLWSPIARHRNASRPAPTLAEPTFEKMWVAQRGALARMRGSDLHDTAPGEPGGAMEVPRTTYADALDLAVYWSKALVQLQAKVMADSIPMPAGFEEAQARWHAASDVERYGSARKPEDVYPRNHELWRAMHALSMTLGVLDAPPTPYVLPDVPRAAVADLPSRIADAAGTVAQAISKFAHDAGTGLAAGLGKPLLIGGGVLLGLILLLHSTHDRKAA
ncbi:MAG TPA: hypothetical protein VFT22_25510 [Kofleriaceae bacterium]|nr:hypothetical protein [Kofleriaceae bacterium]